MTPQTWRVSREQKQRRARIDTQRILDGLDPIYNAKEMDEEQARVHREYYARHQNEPAPRAATERRGV